MKHHKKAKYNLLGLKLSPRKLDRFRNTGALMLSGNQSQIDTKGAIPVILPKKGKASRI